MWNCVLTIVFARTKLAIFFVIWMITTLFEGTVQMGESGAAWIIPGSDYRSNCTGFISAGSRLPEGFQLNVGTHVRPRTSEVQGGKSDFHELFSRSPEV